uniref:Uncharacterized protein n=1 Tax=Geospiza parvula TaxID=87175 RepID=A0A8U8BH98_GEOPR
MGGKEQNSPIYISRVIPGGVADRHGGLKRGDHVNGVSVEGEQHERAVELLKAAQGSVKLVVRYTPRVLRGDGGALREAAHGTAPAAQQLLVIPKPQNPQIPEFSNPKIPKSLSLQIPNSLSSQTPKSLSPQIPEFPNPKPQNP